MTKLSDAEPRSNLIPDQTPGTASEHAEVRRNFLGKLVAVVTGGLILAVPAGLGVGFLLDPLRRPRSGGKGSAGGRRDEEGFLPVAALDSLPADGRPQSFTVYDDLVDAWNKVPNQPVGRVFLRRKADGNVLAFNARCPHLGCTVDYRQADEDFFCPCHTSAFTLDGIKKNEIPPRGMDELAVKIKNGTEVWVRYKVYKAGTPDKIAVGA